MTDDGRGEGSERLHTSILPYLAGLIGGSREPGGDARMEMRELIGEKARRGQGTGIKATYLWLYLVFHVMRLNKVYLYSYDTNIRNINLNARLGFDLQGILYEERRVNSRFADVLRMSLTNRKWRALYGDGTATRRLP